MKVAWLGKTAYSFVGAVQGKWVSLVNVLGVCVGVLGSITNADGQQKLVFLKDRYKSLFII